MGETVREIKKIDILYLSDNNYATYMGISILSLFENNKHFHEINIYIIDDEISLENKEKLDNIAVSYKRNIIYLDVSMGIEKLQKLGAPKYRNSYTTYLKLFTFGILPKAVQKVFFIDSDSIVVGKLDELLNFDMQGNPIAAVADALSLYDKTFLGYGVDELWCNMGVMLVDVPAWNDQHCEERIVAQMKIRSAFVAVDQNLLNISLHNDITVLHPRYNLTPHCVVYSYEAFMRSFPQKNTDTKEVVEEAIAHPVILHFERFIGESPWHVNSVSPFVKEFDYYLFLSPWKDMIKEKANTSLTMKIEKILFKIFPPDIFLRFFVIAYKHYIKVTNKKLAGGASNISV